MNLTIESLRQQYKCGSISVREVWSHLHKEALACSDMNIWIHLLDEKEIEPYLSYIESHSEDSLPLWGIPFAIKDNIDLGGIPTTAACKEYSYIPSSNAYLVQKLIEAGALPIGKTNLDQFATGLVGTRSPYGEVHNAFIKENISGGSSSGSAVAVAKGLVAFSLGTDTAGSGRVPASLNNLVGWKPSLGAWSNRGVVPACESIDSVTVFTHSIDEAEIVDKVLRTFDSEYRYSRVIEEVREYDAACVYLPKQEPEFFGDKASEYRSKWLSVVENIEKNFSNVKRIDTSILLEAASILYDGPWVAERYAGLKEFLDKESDTLFPVTKKIICGAMEKQLSAVDLFTAMHRLAEIKHIVHQLLEDSILIMPTNGGTFTRKQVDEDPIATNSKMGLYTNHCNLLDLCAVNVPIGFADEGYPMGITLFSKSGREGLVAKAGRTISNQMMKDYLPLAVCGLHMKGFALESQLTSIGAVYERTTYTTPDYKMFELATNPPKPGLFRVSNGGKEQEIEIWNVPKEKVGIFMSNIPEPLGLGKLTTRDGENVTGFICEEYAQCTAKEITEYGGWRYRS